MEHQGGVDFVAMEGTEGTVGGFGHDDTQHIDNLHAGRLGDYRREGFDMRIMPMCRYEYEFSYSTRFPGINEIVEGTEQRLATKTCAPGTGAFQGGVNAVLERGGAKDLQFCREVVDQSVDDDGVAPQGQVRAVRLAGANGNQKPGIAAQGLGDFARLQFLDPQGLGY